MKKYALKNRIKGFFRKYKTTVFVVTLCLQLAIGLAIYFLFGRISPNDEIFVPKEGSVAFLINENPNFSVDFGKVEEPDKQWVRFEAQTSAKNPFEEEDGNIFRKITNLFQKKERYGIEMSLVGVDLKGEELEKYGEEVIQVADVIGTDNVKTSTELVDSGREIGVYEDQETPVSKHTVLNKDVASGVDLEYQILKGLGLKEEIIIRDLEAYKDSCKGKGCSLPLNEFVFDLKMDSDVELKEGWFTIDGKSTSTYYFVDRKGRYIAHFLPNFAIDSIGNKTFDVNLKVEKGEGNNYRAKVTVDLGWLLSSERVFPVRIDPSIVHDDTADFSGGIFNRVESVTGPKIQLLAAKAPIADANTVGLWHLNESNGSGAYLLDSSVNGNNGTPTGTTYTSSGKFGGARSFNGSSDYITIPNSPTPASTLTIESWIRINTASAGTIYNWGVTSGCNPSSQSLAVSSNKLTFYTGCGTTLTSVDSLTIGVWTHVAVTIDSSGKAILYINGVQESSPTNTRSGQSVSTGNDQIGVVWYGGSRSAYFNGSIDEVRISNIARTPAQIQSSYLDGISKFSGTYTSSILDLGSSVSDMTMSWTPSGVNTGNGETPYSTTNMVCLLYTSPSPRDS